MYELGKIRKFEDVSEWSETNEENVKHIDYLLRLAFGRIHAKMLLSEENFNNTLHNVGVLVKMVQGLHTENQQLVKDLLRFHSIVQGLNDKIQGLETE